MNHFERRLRDRRGPPVGRLGDPTCAPRYPALGRVCFVVDRAGREARSRPDGGGLKKAGIGEELIDHIGSAVPV